MHLNRSTCYALQVAVCGICLRSIDFTSDCYRANRVAGGLAHIPCVAVVMADSDDGPSLTDAELANAVNEATAELCSKLCENPDHPSIATECRHDVEMLGAVGCSPDRPEVWAADHFHAIMNGTPCICRHGTAPEANAAHGDGQG